MTAGQDMPPMVQTQHRRSSAITRPHRPKTRVAKPIATTGVSIVCAGPDIIHGRTRPENHWRGHEVTRMLFLRVASARTRRGSSLPPLTDWHKAPQLLVPIEDQTHLAG